MGYGEDLGGSSTEIKYGRSLSSEAILKYSEFILSEKALVIEEFFNDAKSLVNAEIFALAFFISDFLATRSLALITSSKKFIAKSLFEENILTNNS